VNVQDARFTSQKRLFLADLNECIVRAVDFAAEIMAQNFSLVVPKGRSTKAKLQRNKSRNRCSSRLCASSWTQIFDKITFRLAPAALFL